MIGLMSDSHDDLEGVRRAIEFFNSEGVDMVLHAGDIISPFTVPLFVDLESEIHAVYGNNDGERRMLGEAFKTLGSEIKDIAEIRHKGLRMCLYHGVHEAIVCALAESREYDLVVRGHTHKKQIIKKEDTLVVNPGEVCGYLTGKKTVALLDTKNMDVRFEEL